MRIFNADPMVLFSLETGINWRRHPTNTLDGWKSIKFAAACCKISSVALIMAPVGYFFSSNVLTRDSKSWMMIQWLSFEEKDEGFFIILILSPLVSMYVLSPTVPTCSLQKVTALARVSVTISTIICMALGDGQWPPLGNGFLIHLCPSSTMTISRTKGDLIHIILMDDIPSTSAIYSNSNAKH